MGALFAFFAIPSHAKSSGQLQLAGKQSAYQGVAGFQCTITFSGNQAVTIRSNRGKPLKFKSAYSEEEWMVIAAAAKKGSIVSYPGVEGPALSYSAVLTEANGDPTEITLEMLDGTADRLNVSQEAEELRKFLVDCCFWSHPDSEIQIPF